MQQWYNRHDRLTFESHSTMNDPLNPTSHHKRQAARLVASALIQPSPQTMRERLTFGVLIGWNLFWTPNPYGYLTPLFQGFNAAVSHWGCNLLVACGMGSQTDITDPTRPAWPTVANDVDFVPVGPWNTDGIIVVNPLITPSRSLYVHELMKTGHPVVFVACGEGEPAVIADNEGGIRDALTHLIETHGHRKIAFVAGNPGDMEGDSGFRLRAYEAEMQRFGLELNSELIAFGYHTPESGYTAMQQILASQAEFTAVLASNDESALGAMQALKEAGLHIPEDVALIGFDDRQEAPAQEPPLTTVHVPLFDSGYRAVEMLLQLYEGRPDAPRTLKIPTRLAIRESCGCRRTIRIPIDTTSVAQPNAAFNPATLVQRMTEAMLSESHGFNHSEHIHSICESLSQSFVSSLEQQDSREFERVLEKLLSETDEDAHNWQAVISKMRSAVPDLFDVDQQSALYLFALEMLDLSRERISERMRRRHRQHVIEQKWMTTRIAHLTTRLLMTSDEAQIRQILASDLPLMGIAHTNLGFFEREGDDPVAWSLLYAIPDGGKSSVRFPTRQFPPTAVYAPDEAFALVIVPLVLPSGQIGFVAYDAPNELAGPITQQIAAALHNSRLYSEATEGRKLAEEANRLKSTFLSMVSHELRTPLNLISGLSEILLQRQHGRDRGLPDQVRKDLEQIFSSAQHLGYLIRDVLDLASSEVGQLRLENEPLNLSHTLQMVAATGRQMARDKGLAWRESLPAEPLWVWGDRTRLRQVALNLVSNAIKFTAHGEVHLRVAVEADQAVVTVSDTGLGIPLGEQSLIFDEFHRSEQAVKRGFRGLGLGLAIAKRLVELHNGEIGMASSGKMGEGSNFYFTLPLLALDDPRVQARLAESETPDDPFTSDQRESDKVFVIVDDDPATLDMHIRIIQSRYDQPQIFKATNGREALELITEHQPDLVLLDLMIPEIDGFGVLEVMREQDASQDIPVILFTGQMLTETEMERLNRSLTTVLGKGLFSVEEILQHIDAALAKKPRLGRTAQRLVRQAMAYIHEHYDEPISREDVAEYLGISNDYLTASFRREVGMTFVAYLNRYRMNQAKIMLSESLLSITEVAMAMGYSDSSYFSRVFRQHIGVSPEEYRRTHNKKQK